MNKISLYIKWHDISNRKFYFYKKFFEKIKKSLNKKCANEKFINFLANPSSYFYFLDKKQEKYYINCIKKKNFVWEREIVPVSKLNHENLIDFNKKNIFQFVRFI